MILHVKEAKHLHDYVLWVRFNDGAEGEVDLKNELEGEVFAPLKDPAVFRLFRVHPLFQTLVWPNEADMAPEFLYDKMVPVTFRGRARSGGTLALAAGEPGAKYVVRKPRASNRKKP
ncbi:MAG: DUF2442 domain-containing protein [bacterium]